MNQHDEPVLPGTPASEEQLTAERKSDEELRRLNENLEERVRQRTRELAEANVS